MGVLGPIVAVPQVSVGIELDNGKVREVFLAKSGNGQGGADAVLSTDPGEGSMAPRGSLITLVLV